MGCQAADRAIAGTSPASGAESDRSGIRRAVLRRWCRVVAGSLPCRRPTDLRPCASRGERRDGRGPGGRLQSGHLGGGRQPARRRGPDRREPLSHRPARGLAAGGNAGEDRRAAAGGPGRVPQRVDLGRREPTSRSRPWPSRTCRWVSPRRPITILRRLAESGKDPQIRRLLAQALLAGGETDAGGGGARGRAPSHPRRPRARVRPGPRIPGAAQGRPRGAPLRADRRGPADPADARPHRPDLPRLRAVRARPGRASRGPGAGPARPARALLPRHGAPRRRRAGPGWTKPSRSSRRSCSSRRRTRWRTSSWASPSWTCSGPRRPCLPSRSRPARSRRGRASSTTSAAPSSRGIAPAEAAASLQRALELAEGQGANRARAPDDPHPARPGAPEARPDGRGRRPLRARPSALRPRGRTPSASGWPATWPTSAEPDGREEPRPCR